MLINRETLVEYIKDELSAGLVNLELDDNIINRNIDQALMLSSDYWNYTTFKTVTPKKTMHGFGGVIELSELDDSSDGAVPVVVNVYPTSATMNMSTALIGLPLLYINSGQGLENQLSTYSSMLNRLSMMESLLGRSARVVGDKLFVDKYIGPVTVEYIPQVVALENINEGSWIIWIKDYVVALSKRQLAQARGKYKVGSNPSEINAAQLLEEANSKIADLMEQLSKKGIIYASRL